MTRKLLTDEQIKEAKALKEKGWSKERLAWKFQVSPTTIFDHVYATKKRSKKYIQTRTCCYFCDQPLENHPRCESCGMLVHDDISKGEYTEKYVCGCGVNHTARFGKWCVACAAKKRKINFPHTDHKHTHEELSRLFGESREQIVKQEKTANEKILNDKRFKKTMLSQDSDRYAKYTREKLKKALQILEQIPHEYSYGLKGGVIEQLQDWRNKVE